MNIILTFIIIFLIIFLLLYFWHSLLKVPSYQLRISPSGFRKIPKLLLKLAKVDKQGDVTWQDLNKTEEEAMMKYYEKFQDVSSMNLTFLYNQNLVHTQLSDKSYFFPLDKNQNYLVQEKIGSFDKDSDIEFILYRRPQGWFKSPILVGYLKRVGKYSFSLKDKDKETEVLFEFPEALVKKTFFTGGLENKFKLKKNSDAFGGYKNDLGDEEPYSGFTSYDQEHHNGSNFNFLIHH